MKPEAIQGAKTLSAEFINSIINYFENRINNYALENLYPVGARYIQFPEPDGSWNPAEAPGNKFGGLWVLRFATEGTFFRTEGDPYSEGQTHNRTNGLQTDQFQGHWHRIGADGTAAGTGSRYTVAGVGRNGAELNSVHPPPTMLAETVSLRAQTVNTDGANGVIRIGKETRPINRLMRIYERIE